MDATLEKFDQGRAAIFPRQKFSFGSRVARKVLVFDVTWSRSRWAES